MLLSQLRKEVSPPWLYCCSSSGFAAPLVYNQSLWNMRNSKRLQVRHPAVHFISTLISSVAGRKRARVLAVLRWSEGGKAWPSQKFLQHQLDPGVWRSGSCSRPALCPPPWTKLYCRRWCEHVKHLEGSSYQLLYSTEKISLSSGVCNMSPSSVLSLAQDKWAAGVCSKVSVDISILKISLCLLQDISRRESGQVFFSLRINTFP